MKICVIGGTGQQGYQQVLACLEQGYEVARHLSTRLGQHLACGGFRGGHAPSN